MFKKQVIMFLIVLLAFASCKKDKKEQVSYPTNLSPAIGSNGMVSTAHPLATRAGLSILRAGGNAFDAAVTVAAMLNVVEPMNSGIGGYGTILIYDAVRGKTRFLDSSGKIPIHVNSDVFRPPTPNFRENRRGAKAVSTPGNVNAWGAMSSEYGRFDWEELFDAPIKAAEDGFEIKERLARAIHFAFSDFNSYGQSVYGKKGEPLEKGDVLIQKDLGR